MMVPLGHSTSGPPHRGGGPGFIPECDSGTKLDVVPESRMECCPAVDGAGERDLEVQALLTVSVLPILIHGS